MDTTILHHQEGRDKIPLPTTREGCHTLIIQLKFDIAAIRDQLATADMDRQANGGRVDADWFYRARTALRFKQMELAQVQEHLRRMPGGGAARKVQFKDCIIATVRSRFTDDQWRAVLDDAHHLLQEGGA